MGYLPSQLVPPFFTQNLTHNSLHDPLQMSPSVKCQGQIEKVVQGQNEIRLTLTGAAEHILVYTNQGNLTASTLEAGSAGEYRIRTPGPATAVQLDNCPPLNLR